MAANLSPAPPRLHVLMTANSAWNVLHFRRPILDLLLGEGHRVTILAPVDQAAGELESLGCTVLPLTMDPRSLNPASAALLAWRMRSAMARCRPDLVFSFTIKNNILGALVSRTLGIPFYPNVSGLGTAFLSGSMLEAVAIRIYRLAFNRLPAVFFQNQEDRLLFLTRGIVREEQCRTLPGSGIDIERFAPVPIRHNGRSIVFLMIARILRDKGVLEFIEAARMVRERFPHARFQILGEADSQNRSAVSSAEIAQWPARYGVTVLPRTRDVRSFIAAADCVVLPSYREGLPRTLLEGAAMGRALIATDVPGCRDVVEHGVNGYLCPARDVRALAAAMTRLLILTPEQRADMGRAGRDLVVRRFDQRLVAAAYRSALRDAAARKDSSPHA